MPEKIGAPHYKNDIGVDAINIGVKEFQCMGASPPFDHPHIYMDMGNEEEIICPYCSTLYRHRPHLARHETEPAGCLAEISSHI